MDAAEHGEELGTQLQRPWVLHRGRGGAVPVLHQGHELLGDQSRKVLVAAGEAGPLDALVRDEARDRADVGARRFYGGLKCIVVAERRRLGVGIEQEEGTAGRRVIARPFGAGEVPGGMQAKPRHELFEPELVRKAYIEALVGEDVGDEDL